jgi:hypothetical protein
MNVQWEEPKWRTSTKNTKASKLEKEFPVEMTIEEAVDRG